VQGKALVQTAVGVTVDSANISPTGNRMGLGWNGQSRERMIDDVIQFLVKENVWQEQTNIPTLSARPQETQPKENAGTHKERKRKVWPACSEA
jgi:hypothetical protein